MSRPPIVTRPDADKRRVLLVLSTQRGKISVAGAGTGAGTGTAADAVIRRDPPPPARMARVVLLNICRPNCPLALSPPCWARRCSCGYCCAGAAW